MIFSLRDVEILRLVQWCQYARPADLLAVTTETELSNLLALGLLKSHAASGALVLTARGTALLQEAFPDVCRLLCPSYHSDAIQRRLRLSRILLTAYGASLQVFSVSVEALCAPSTLFLSAITRTRGQNPWGSTRVAALAHLGDWICALHYVTQNIGTLSLHDEIAAFYNQTAHLPPLHRAFIFLGENYDDLLAELTAPQETESSTLQSYGAAWAASPYSVFLVPCNRTGMIQLRLLAIPRYREALSRTALQGQYQPPDDPLWDATFQGVPFLVAVDMDLHRLDTAIAAAQEQGFPSVAMVALAEQAETVLHTRYRDTGLARVFTLTEEALASVLGPDPIPYRPPQIPYVTEKGAYLHAPLIQTAGKTGRPRGTPLGQLGGSS